MLAALRPLQTITALAHLSEAQHESHASFTLVRNTTLIAAQAIKEAVRAILDLRRSEFRPFLNLEAAIEDPAPLLVLSSFPSFLRRPLHCWPIRHVLKIPED
ncbi:hypothetical protein PAPYR_12322 [Paratrimastix pyriformis]|uniref:Uncharacterized protein n=1 Tax=Paratrimastix pyriformis TaxID=342808 RepID=A0ABQ8U232_9EUKA|nr:hypothetical protein PAPYR_12322 [Paratrimastix pyriformis]